MTLSTCRCLGVRRRHCMGVTLVGSEYCPCALYCHLLTTRLPSPANGPHHRKAIPRACRGYLVTRERVPRHRSSIRTFQLLFVLCDWLGCLIVDWR